MSDDKESKHHHEKSEEELPLPWKRIQSAIWLIGLAIIAWQGWWWPGILVLVAISGIFQAIIQMMLAGQEKEAQVIQQQNNLNQERGRWLPATCPNCGAPLNVNNVNWTGDNNGNCPFCQANLRPPVT
jgi:hypothetical protein